jgi:hypothetical protein
MPYGSTPEQDDGDLDQPRIIGQVTGPKSMSEYSRDFGLDVDPQFECDNMGRRNGYALPKNVPSVGVHGR